MASKNFSVRIDETTRKEAEQLFETMGLSLGGAINLFLRQSILRQSLPFEVITTDSLSKERLIAYATKLSNLEDEK